MKVLPRCLPGAHLPYTVQRDLVFAEQLLCAGALLLLHMRMSPSLTLSGVQEDLHCHYCLKGETTRCL